MIRTRIVLFGFALVCNLALAQGGGQSAAAEPVDSRFAGDIDSAAAKSSEKRKVLAQIKTDFEQKRQAARDAVKSHERVATDAEAAVGRAQGEVNNFLAQQDALRKKLSSKTSGWRWSPLSQAESDEIADLGIELKAVGAKVKTAQDAVIAANKANADAAQKAASLQRTSEMWDENYAGTDKAEKEAAEQVKKDKEAMKTQIAALAAQVRNAKLGTKLSQLESDLKNSELGKAVIESEMNKGLLAEFMKKKMVGLMTDPAFCKFSNFCANPGANSRNEKPNLDTLFDSVERERKGAAQAAGDEKKTH